MLLKCDKLDNLLAFCLAMWYVGDNLVFFIESYVSHHFYSFLGRNSSCICPHCSFAASFMPRRKIVSSGRDGEGNIEHERVHPFAHDYVVTIFDVVPLEMRKKILLLETKESRE